MPLLSSAAHSTPSRRRGRRPAGSCPLRAQIVVRLSAEQRARLAEEASACGVPMGRLLRDLWEMDPLGVERVALSWLAEEQPDLDPASVEGQRCLAELRAHARSSIATYLGRSPC